MTKGSVATLILTGVLLQVSTVQGQTAAPHHSPLAFQIWLAPGYSEGDLNWNIAAPGGSPDVLSELLYEDVRTLNVELGARLNIQEGPFQNLVLEAAAQWGHIQEGDGHDRDWASDNRTGLFSYSASEVEGDRIDRYSLAVGYKISLSGSVFFMPMAGYDHREQNINFTKGVQITSSPVEDLIPPPPGPFDGLDSHYNTTWRSPWIGFETGLTLHTDHQLLLRAEYHRPDFEADATWNLRQDFAQPTSFEHDADNGDGYRVRLGYRYSFLPQWQLLIQLDWERFNVTKGVDRLYRIDSENWFPPRVVTEATPLNEVKWRQYGVSAGLAWHF